MAEFEVAFWSNSGDMFIHSKMKFSIKPNLLTD